MDTRKSSIKTPSKEKRRRKPKKEDKNISIETVLRRSFHQALKEYVMHSSIGGIKQIFERKNGWKQRLIWLNFFILMVIGFGYFLQDTWYNAMARPLILTPQSDTELMSDTEFPAIALCNINRISKASFLELIQEAEKRYPHLKSDTIKKYLSELGRLLDFSYDEIFDDYRQGAIFGKENYYSKNFTEVMKRLAPNCTKMLTRCSWNGEIVDCKSLFSTRRTIRGHCCAFNYVVDYDDDGYPVKTKKAAHQQIPGFFHGLNVIIDPMVEDYYYPLNAVVGFDVFIFDPLHFADPSAGKVVHRLAEPDRIEFMEMKSVRQIASDEVRKYAYSTRKCLFKDEYSARFHNTYSYSACILQCRIKSVLSLCQCIPYYLPSGSNHDEQACLIDDLKCLNKYKEKFIHLYPSYADTKMTDELETQMEDSMHCSDCLPDCEYTQHVVNSYKIDSSKPLFKAHKTYGFTEGINLTNKCALSIYYVNTINDLNRLDVVSHWYQILSNIGGFGGILIGISVFSVVEIVYFLLVRFVQLICQCYF